MLLYYLLFCILLIKVLSEPICVEGENLCIKCHPITKLCIQCEKDIYIPDKNGGCVYAKKCILGNNYCFECFEDGQLCKQCDIGYFPDENGGCSTTENCEVSYKGECLKCKDNYILIGKKGENLSDRIKLCKPLTLDPFLHCIDIYTELGICNKCEDGYFLSFSDLKCTKVNHCAYSSYGECKKCDFGYYFNKKTQECLIQEGIFTNCKISNNGTKCDECDEDSYFDQQGKCVWSKFCEEGDRYHCNKCIDGYYLTTINGMCTTEENCFNGRKDLGICIQCKEFYCTDYKDGKCKSNLENNDYKFCTYSDKEGCTQCVSGAFLSKDKKCSKTTNCENVGKGNCTKCVDNYYLGLDNKCTNIENCIYSDNDYNCIECKDNFYFNKLDNKCTIAEGNFENCKYGSADQKCERCKNDFYLNQTDSQCYSNKNNEKFNKCSISNGEYCVQCLDGYFLGSRDNKCSKIENCLVIENEDKCLYCNDIYCANAKTGKCFFNFIIESEEEKFLYRCNRTNNEATECAICLDGYILKNGLCYDEKHCSERDEDGNCKMCKKIEEEKYNQCLNNIFGCIENKFYDNCWECNDINEIGHCTKCMDGYKLNKYDFCIADK